MKLRCPGSILVIQGKIMSVDFLLSGFSMGLVYGLLLIPVGATIPCPCREAQISFTAVLKVHSRNKSLSLY